MTTAAPRSAADARNQVAGAARELATAVGLDVVNAWAGLESCNDQGVAPFRGRAVLHYPPAASRHDALKQSTAYLDILRRAGWNCRPAVPGSAPAAHKSGITAFFEVQGEGAPVRVLTVVGQCRVPTAGPDGLRLTPITDF